MTPRTHNQILFLREQNSTLANGYHRLVGQNNANTSVIAGLQRQLELVVQKLAQYETQEQATAVDRQSVEKPSSSATTGNVEGAPAAGPSKDRTATSMPDSPDHEPFRSQTGDDHYGDINAMDEGFHIVSQDTK